MTFAIHFSRHIMPNYSQRCCKILQHPQFRNFKALLQGKECISFVVPVHSRYCYTEGTKHIPLIRAEFKNLHKQLELIDNLWNKAIEDGELHLDKVRGERLSFEAADDRNRYFSNEMMKVFQSSAEADEAIEVGEELSNLLEKCYPHFPMIDHPRRKTIIRSIQKGILELDAFITAKRPLPRPTRSNILDRWQKILRETDNPRVERLKAVLKAADIDEYFFSLVVGLLFLGKPNQNYDDVPPLTEFEPDEIKFAVQPRFDVHCYCREYRWMVEYLNSDTALKCVTHVIMKPITEFST